MHTLFFVCRKIHSRGGGGEASTPLGLCCGCCRGSSCAGVRPRVLSVTLLALTKIQVKSVKVVRTFGELMDSHFSDSRPASLSPSVNSRRSCVLLTMCVLLLRVAGSLGSSVCGRNETKHYCCPCITIVYDPCRKVARKGQGTSCPRRANISGLSRLLVYLSFYISLDLCSLV